MSGRFRDLAEIMLDDVREFVCGCGTRYHAAPGFGCPSCDAAARLQERTSVEQEIVNYVCAERIAASNAFQSLRKSHYAHQREQAEGYKRRAAALKKIEDALVRGLHRCREIHGAGLPTVNSGDKP
jgi:hypothetical protein